MNSTPSSSQFDSVQLREWDNQHVWHPFAPMTAYIQEAPPIIASAKGFNLFDCDGRAYLDGISSLWCNLHGHAVPEITQAVARQLGKVGHTTLLGLSSEVSIRLAKALVDCTPDGLNKVFYSDSGSTAVEAALKLAYQYHHQKPNPESQRDTFFCVGNAYHGDTLGSVSVGNIDVFHQVYKHLLFPTIPVPSPTDTRIPAGHTKETWIQNCFDRTTEIVKQNHERAAGFVIEPLVQGAAGILVHPPGFLKHVRNLCTEFGIPMIADEVAVGFGRTGTLFACEQEDVQPDLMCLAKGITGGYLPLAATLATDEIYDAFLGQPTEGRTFFHGHTYTGNSLACAAAIASLGLFQENNVLDNIAKLSLAIDEELAACDEADYVLQVRKKGIMVGIELVPDRTTGLPFAPELRIGQQVAVEARKHGVIIRPLGDTIVLMPAPAMPEQDVRRLCQATLAAVKSVVNRNR